MTIFGPQFGFAFYSPERDDGIEVCSASLKPAVGEEALAGPAAVDLHTLWLRP